MGEALREKMAYKFSPTRQTIAYGKVDEMIFNRIADDAPIIGEMISDLANDPADPNDKNLHRSHIEALEFDAYNALIKYKPTRTGTGDPLIADIMDRATRDPLYPQLRAATVGDDLASAVGACGLVRTIVAGLPESVKEAANDHAKADADATQAEQEADAMQHLFDEGDPDADPTEIAQMQTFAKYKRQQAQQAAQAVRGALKDSGRAIGQIVAKGIQGSTEQAESIRAATDAFGFGNAATGGGMPIEEKFRLAKLIQNQGKRFRDLVDLIGRMQATAERKQAEKMNHDGGEIVDIVQGDDIGLLLDDEIALLRHPKLGRIHRGRLMDADLSQFEVESKEPKANGDIVILLDESGSMSGAREAEAKAITLAIAHIALKQRRKLIVHCFQHTVTATITLDGTDSGAQAVSLAMRGLSEIATRGTGGGTNFDGPFRTAIQSSKTLRDPDIIIITDGHANTSAETLQMLAEERKRNGLSVFSMLIGSTDNSTDLKKFSDRIWCADSLIGKAAPELFELL